MQLGSESSAPLHSRDGSALHVGQTMTFKDWLIRKVPLIYVQRVFKSEAIEHDEYNYVKTRFLQSLKTVKEALSDDAAAACEPSIAIG